ncbi:MAG TPA: S8 family peptidase [Steroidobacteraceae bacterium]|nr:S8 family peptidase [Steroidobacteraceae bacterium]
MKSAETVTQLIVRYKKDPSDAELTPRMAVAKRAGAARGLALAHGRRGALGIHVLKIGRQIPVGDALALAKDLAASDPNIEYAEPDYIVYPDLVPNDPYYSSFQPHYQNTPGGIFAPQAWDRATGTGVVVAVIDTGYRPHADLAPNLLPGYDFISDSARARDGNGRDASALDEGNWHNWPECGIDEGGRNSNWHGTHVAGTIAAVTNNFTGVAGVAFNSRVVPVRVLGRCGGNTSDIADAIVWASGGSVSGVPANPNPARVLNLSLGSTEAGGCGSTYQNAIDSARSRNAVVVVSAGNSNTTANHRPGNCNGVITVAATNYAGGRASYSNYGPLVEIAAPGGDTDGYVWSTMNTGTTTPGSDTYGGMAGTSMAAPHVAGVVALMLSGNPSLTPVQVVATLVNTARAFPAPCSGCGAGIVHAANAVNAVIPPSQPTITLPAILSISGTHPTDQAVGMIWLDASGELLISQGPYVTPYGSWINPRVGMANYQARAVSNTGCNGPGADWVSLAQGVAWDITSSGGPGSYSFCSFFLQIRHVSDPSTILAHSEIWLSASTDMY